MKWVEDGTTYGVYEKTSTDCHIVLKLSSSRSTNFRDGFHYKFTDISVSAPLYSSTTVLFHEGGIDPIPRLTTAVGISSLPHFHSVREPFLPDLDSIKLST